MFKSEFSKVGQSLKFNAEHTNQIFTVTITTITTPTGGSKTKIDPLVRKENKRKSNAKRFKNKNKKRIEQIYNQELLNSSSDNNLESLVRLTVKPSDRIQNFLTNKQAVINPNNNDNLCLIRAILIGKKLVDNKHLNYYDKETSQYIDKLRIANTVNSKAFTKQANDLANLLKFDISKPLSITDIDKIEVYLMEYRIVCFDWSTSKYQPIHHNKSSKCKKFIYIAYHNNHFYTIKSINAFMNTSYFCDYCLIGYSHKTNHTCVNRCMMCKDETCGLRLEFLI